MKKIILFLVIVLLIQPFGCSHTRRLSKSTSIIKTDSLNEKSGSLKKSLTDSSNSLVNIRNESSSHGKEITLNESTTKFDDSPIILTGNFKVDTAKGGGIRLTAGGITVDANYDLHTGLIKVKVTGNGTGERTTYTKQLTIRDSGSTKIQDSTGISNQVKTENIDSAGKEKAKIANVNIDKQKVVVSKTKWPVLQLIGLGVAIILIIWILAKRKSIITWIKNKLAK